jgi:hypothetical protein
MQQTTEPLFGNLLPRFRSDWMKRKKVKREIVGDFVQELAMNLGQKMANIQDAKWNKRNLT